jgi:cold shock CspA family protein
MRGTLTHFNENSGIGRITTDQGVDLQVHKGSIDPCPSPLCQGQTVEFRIYYGPNGPIAENVHQLQSWFRI